MEVKILSTAPVFALMDQWTSKPLNEFISTLLILLAYCIDATHFIVNPGICNMPLGAVPLQKEKMVSIRLPVPSMIQLSNDNTTTEYRTRFHPPTHLILKKTSSPMLTVSCMPWTSLKIRSSRARHQSHPSLGLRKNLQYRFIDIRRNAQDLYIDQFLPKSAMVSFIDIFWNPLSLRNAKSKRSVLHGRLQNRIHKKEIPNP